MLKESIPNTQYNTWKLSRDPLLRARARLGAMLFVYPAQMGRNEFLPKALPDIPSHVPREKENF